MFLLTEEAFASSVNICALFIQHYVTFLCTFTGNFLPAAKLSKIFPSFFTVVYINVNIGCKQYIKIVTLKTFYVHGFRRHMYCIVNILLFPNGYCISYVLPFNQLGHILLCFYIFVHIKVNNCP